MSGRQTDPRLRLQAVRFLARREYAFGELCRRLEQAGAPPDQARAVVEELCERGLQSDRRFLESRLRQRLEQGRGPLAMKAELVELGLEEAMVEAGIEKLCGDWVGQARKLCRNHFGELRCEARQEAFLYRRGFSEEQVMLALQEGEDQAAIR